MKRSSILEARRKLVNQEVRQQVDLSFQIVDRIHEILTEKGIKQKDLTVQLGKKEAEISKWMLGTHNFTIDTLVAMLQYYMLFIKRKYMLKKEDSYTFGAA